MGICGVFVQQVLYLVMALVPSTAVVPLLVFFSLDLVFFHFIQCSGVFSWLSSVFFMSELNVINCTILCNS